MPDDYARCRHTRGVFNHRTADSVFGKHTLDGFVYDEFGFFGHKFLVLNFFETADVTRMITVVFLFKFFTGEANLIGIDDNDVIARIDVGSERGFILPRRTIAT